MDKREEIIKKLENYEPYAAHFSHLAVEGGLLLDVLQFLREQHKVPVKRSKTRPDARYPYSCGNCGSYLQPTWLACPMCGKMVMWIQDSEAQALDSLSEAELNEPMKHFED